MKKKTFKRQGGIYLEEKTRIDIAEQTPEEWEAALRALGEEMRKPWEPDVRSVLTALKGLYTTEEGNGFRMQPIAVQAATGLAYLNKAEASPENRLEYAFRAGAAYSKAIALIAEDCAWEGRKFVDARGKSTGRIGNADCKAAMLEAWKAYLMWHTETRQRTKPKVPAFFEWLSRPDVEGKANASAFGLALEIKCGQLAKAKVEGEDWTKRSTVQKKWIRKFRDAGWDIEMTGNKRKGLLDRRLEIKGNDGSTIDISARELAEQSARKGEVPLY